MDGLSLLLLGGVLGLLAVVFQPRATVVPTVITTAEEHGNGCALPVLLVVLLLLALLVLGSTPT